MRLVCPSCGAMHSAEAWASEPDARESVKTAGELPQEIGRRVFHYLALFRPRTGRGLMWRKVLRLLKEIQEFISKPHIQWKHKPARPNSTRAWWMAMERVIENPPKRLPLTTINYLRSIVYDIADEMDRALEVRRNQAERTGAARPKRPQSDLTAVSEDADLTPEEIKEKARAIREKNFPKIRKKTDGR